MLQQNKTIKEKTKNKKKKNVLFLHMYYHPHCYATCFCYPIVITCSLLPVTIEHMYRLEYKWDGNP